VPLRSVTASRRREPVDAGALPPSLPLAGGLLLTSGYLLVLDACYLLATSRWGSYVGLPHHAVYLGDVLFGASLLCWVLGGGIARLWRIGRWSRLVWISLLMVAWTVVRLAAGLSLSQVALRDAAPYLYLLAVPVALTVPVSRRWVTSLVSAALVIHVAWLALAIRDPSAVADLPRLGPVRVFSIRTDFDMAVMGIAIGVGIVAAMRAASWWRRLGGLALAAVGTWNVSAMNNRGGLLASGACVLAAAGLLVWEEARADSSARTRTGRAVAALVLCSATGIGFAQSPALGRLHGTFLSPGAQPSHTNSSPAASPAATGPGTAGSSSTPSPSASASSTTKSSPGQPSPSASTTASPAPAITQAEAEAAGTTQARKTAWRDVYRYTTATVPRTLFGVGFGPNFLQASGGLQVLSGGIPGLRAPHNILLNTWARLGAIGLALQIVLLLFGIWAAVLAVRYAGPTDAVAWVLVAVAIPCVAMVGVILESPFGALPYALGLGLLARLARPQPVGRPAKLHP
jgi:hypothetical protein